MRGKEAGSPRSGPLPEDRTVISWAVMDANGAYGPVFLDLEGRLFDGKVWYAIRACLLSGGELTTWVFGSKGRARMRWMEATGGEWIGDSDFERVAGRRMRKEEHG